MVNLDYYYRTDIYEINNILKKGLIYDYYKTSREYGFAVYLTDNYKLNLNNKNVVLNVHLKSLDNILTVTNFQELLVNYLQHVDSTATTNINTASAPVSVDGVYNLQPGDLVALPNQTNVIENGFYLFYEVGKPFDKVIDISSYLVHFGLNERLGQKYIQKYLEANNYSGLRVTSQNLLVLYNSNNIKYIKINEKQI